MTPHVEKQLTAGDAVRDIAIGISNGLVKAFCRSENQLTEEPSQITRGNVSRAAGPPRA